MTDNRLQKLTAGAAFSAALVASLFFHVIPALLSGLLAFVLTRKLLDRLRQCDVPRWMLTHELLTGLLVGFGSLLALGGIGVGIAQLMGGETIRDLMLTLSTTLTQSKEYLPASIAASIPDSVIEMKERLSEYLKQHAGLLAGLSSSALHAVLITLIGWIAGVLAAVRVLAHNTPQPVFATTWFCLWAKLGRSFEQVAFAQCKIAAMNALLTGSFLLVIAPWVGWDIPFAKTMVVVTFLCSLLPVVGNLISNTAIFTLALGVSLPAALAALAFLIVIHKLEYFINARIQGHEIGAQAWELLIVLFAFERLFGPVGMAAAPVFYAFVKSQLREKQWLAH